MDKKITKEQYDKILTTFFPCGYSCATINNDDYDYDLSWYLGWIGIRAHEYCTITFPLEINLDNGGKNIVFMWWPHYADEYTRDEIAGYICGVMSQLMPDMKLVEWPEDNVSSINFEFTNDDR